MRATARWIAVVSIVGACTRPAHPRSNGEARSAEGVRALAVLRQHVRVLEVRADSSVRIVSSGSEVDRIVDGGLAIDRFRINGTTGALEPAPDARAPEAIVLHPGERCAIDGSAHVEITLVRVSAGAAVLQLDGFDRGGRPFASVETIAAFAD